MGISVTYSYINFWPNIYILLSGVAYMCSSVVLKTICVVHIVFIHSCFLYSADPVADLIKYAARRLG